MGRSFQETTNRTAQSMIWKSDNSDLRQKVQSGEVSVEQLLGFYENLMDRYVNMQSSALKTYCDAIMGKIPECTLQEYRERRDHEKSLPIPEYKVIGIVGASDVEGKTQ